MSDLEDDEVYGIVIDGGSMRIKAGFAGDDAPRALFSTAVGNLPNGSALIGFDYKDTYVGDEAQRKRDMLTMRYPIVKGLVDDWDAMESLWHHTFYDELRTDPEEHPVLLTEPPLSPKSQKEKMAEIMMETFKTPGFYVSIQSLLAVYACGRGTCLILDCGDGASHVLPVYEGYSLPNTVQRIEFGGSDVTNYLSGLLTERGYSFPQASEMDIVREMKEKVCFASTDLDRDVALCESSSKYNFRYELPDGHTITLAKERFEPVEALFRPSMVGRSHCGVQDLVQGCLQKCDIDIRKDLFCNIILCGGSTMFSGFAERLQNEMMKTRANNVRFKVIAPPERKFSVWIGGSILASLSTFQSMWVTRDEYDEHGPSVVHKKCFSL